MFPNICLDKFNEMKIFLCVSAIHVVLKLRIACAKKNPSPRSAASIATTCRRGCALFLLTFEGGEIRRTGKEEELECKRRGETFTLEREAIREER